MTDVAQEPLVLYVEVRGDENDGRQYPIGQDGLLVGRSHTCDVMFSNLEVSRRHAYFYSDGDRCTVEDLGSKNGILVNGRQVKKTVLEEGDEVSIGPSRFILRTARPGVGPGAVILPDGSAEREEPSEVAAPAPVARHPLAVGSFAFALLAYVHWAFGLGGVMLAGLALYETRDRSADRGRALIVAALVMGLVGSGMNGWFAGLAPRLAERQLGAAHEECKRNMVAISNALRHYRDEHGHRPEQLGELVSAGLLEQEAVKCPGCLAGGGGACEYYYAPVSAGGGAVLVADAHPSYHGETGGWVLRGNGSIEWVPGERFAAFLSGLRPVPARIPAGGGGR